jgi:hypothetical protein
VGNYAEKRPNRKNHPPEQSGTSPHVRHADRGRAPGLASSGDRESKVKIGNRLATREFHLPGLAPRESDSGLFSWPRDQLWTGGALPVDGPAVPLRRFRKSHHLMQVNFGGARDCGLQRRAISARVGLLRAYQHI